MKIKTASVDRDQHQKVKDRNNSREADAAAIQSGEKYPEEINKENAFFNGKNMRVDFDGAKSLV